MVANAGVNVPSADVAAHTDILCPANIWTTITTAANSQSSITTPITVIQ